MSEKLEGLCGDFSPCDKMKEALAAGEIDNPINNDYEAEIVAEHIALLMTAVATGTCPHCGRNIREDA